MLFHSFKNRVVFDNMIRKNIIDLIKYFIVALVAAIVNIGMLYVFTDLCAISYLISNVFAFILGLITNYTLSKLFVFKNDKLNKMIEFIIYALIGVIGLGIDTLSLWVFTSKLNIYYLISKIIATGVTFIWNFGARKLLYAMINKE